MNNKTVVKVWTFQSDSNPSKTYESLKYSDYSTSCNCPGWTKRSVRSCKHTRAVEMGSATSQAEAHINYQGAQAAPKAVKAPKAAKGTKATAIEGEAITPEGVRRIRW